MVEKVIKGGIWQILITNTWKTAKKNRTIITSKASSK